MKRPQGDRAEGRSIVLLDDQWSKCTTNAHGLYARREKVDLAESVFFRCIFNWYRSMGLIDLMAVGGSGGHLSPSYFDDFVLIPDFPTKVRNEIVRRYHSEGAAPTWESSLEQLRSWHMEWNKRLGVWQAHRLQERLETVLGNVLRQIIDGTAVDVDSELRRALQSPFPSPATGPLSRSE